MNKNDKFQMLRALDAEKWIKDPMRIIELKLDREKRANQDIYVGHSPKCTLTKCHNECKKRGI